MRGGAVWSVGPLERRCGRSAAWRSGPWWRFCSPRALRRSSRVRRSGLWDRRLRAPQPIRRAARSRCASRAPTSAARLASWLHCWRRASAMKRRPARRGPDAPVEQAEVAGVRDLGAGRAIVTVACELGDARTLYLAVPIVREGAGEVAALGAPAVVAGPAGVGASRRARPGPSPALTPAAIARAGAALPAGLPVGVRAPAISPISWRPARRWRRPGGGFELVAVAEREAARERGRGAADGGRHGAGARRRERRDLPARLPPRAGPARPLVRRARSRGRSREPARWRSSLPSSRSPRRRCWLAPDALAAGGNDVGPQHRLDAAPLRGRDLRRRHRDRRPGLPAQPEVHRPGGVLRSPRSWSAGSSSAPTRSPTRRGRSGSGSCRERELRADPLLPADLPPRAAHLPDRGPARCRSPAGCRCAGSPTRRRAARRHRDRLGLGGGGVRRSPRSPALAGFSVGGRDGCGARRTRRAGGHWLGGCGARAARLAAAAGRDPGRRRDARHPGDARTGAAPIASPLSWLAVRLAPLAALARPRPAARGRRARARRASCGSRPTSATLGLRRARVRGPALVFFSAPVCACGRGQRRGGWRGPSAARSRPGRESAPGAVALGEGEVLEVRP